MAAFKMGVPTFEQLSSRIHEGLMAIFSQQMIEIAPLIE